LPDPYDVLTIAAVVDELSATLENGRIQRIGLIDARTIGAEIYARGRRRHLVASADDRLPRLRLAPEMPSLDTALVTPFGLLLRKYLRGGIILGVDQPPLERLVRFSIAKRLGSLKTAPDTAGARSGPDDDAPASITEEEETPEEALDASLTFVSLYVELMGRHSNLILVDNDGAILDSAKRVTPAMSRVRTILPKHAYSPPPPPERLDPRFADRDDFRHLLAATPGNGDLAREIVRAFRGVSPLMAHEIVFRAVEASRVVESDGATQATALSEATQSLLEPLRTRDWSPRVYREPSTDGSGEIVAFSPVPMAHLAATNVEEDFASISEAAAVAESAARAPGAQRHTQRRRRLLDAVDAARVKAQRRLAALENEAARAADVERLRSAGEAIYAHLLEIAPGQSELIVDGDRIALDPGLTASENAQSYFEQYRKAQSAERKLPGLEEESYTEIAYLDQLATMIDQAPGFAEIEALAAEWGEHASTEESQKPRRKTTPKRPKALLDAHGNSILVGRSGPQNDLVTFELAGPDDTWLHARGVGGSHVVIRWRTPGTPEIPETIEAAAALAAWYSAARESGGVEVDIARRRYVRKLKGAGPGMVTYRNERTVRVQPAPEDRLRGVLDDR
jgi:predicted ribosome quality control (RQC) complex YloA/Tae2 family protein